MRILFLNLLMEAEGMGGAENSLLLLLKNLDKKRFVPILVSNQVGRFTDAAAKNGCQTVLLDIEPEALTIYRETFSFNPFILFAKYRKLKSAIEKLQKIVEDERIDIIYTNNIRSHVLGCLVAKKVKKPLVWHFRDILFGQMRLLFNLLARIYPTKVIVVSQAVADNFSNQGKIMVVYNGIEVNSMPLLQRGKNIRSELNLAEQAPLIAFIGRLTAWKRPGDFIQMAALVKKRHSSARFLISGDMAFERNKDFEAELLALRAQLDLEKEVIFMGFRTDISEWLSQVNIVTLLSEHDPFPRVILEAMAAKVPVIATRAGGVPEMVINDQTGFLIEIGDILTLTAKVEQLLDDTDLARNMGERAFERVTEMFRLEENVQQIANILKSLQASITHE